MRWFFSPELTEQAVVKLTMDGTAYDRLKNDIELIGIKLDRVESSDTVEIEYTFSIEYYNIVSQLKSLIVLLNDPSVSSAMIGSYDNLNLLFVELIDAIRNVQKTLEAVESQ
jgi:hypothetical protein